MRRLCGVVALWGLTTVATADEPWPTGSDAGPRIEVPSHLRTLALPLSETARSALAEGDWDAAAAALEDHATDGLVASERADLAFLKAWAAIHRGEDAAREAAPLVSQLATLSSAPAPYRALVEGEVARAQGDGLGALAALERIDDDAVLAPRAQLQRVRILHDLGRTAESAALLEALTARPDPADGNRVALELLAQRRGPGSDAAYAPLRRLWVAYPWSEEARWAEDLLASRYPERSPTVDEVVTRADRWMDAGAYDRALEVSEAAVGRTTPGTVTDCRLHYLRGRSHYKRNRLSQAVSGFGDGGTTCVGVEGGEGHKIRYLEGYAQFRRGRFTASAAAYRTLATDYADTTYADDGLTRAGIALYEAGDLDGALALWREALERFPDGDTVPEATWRLAFTLYDQGRPDEALEAARALGALDPVLDRVHVLAGRYWSARWRLYPDVDAPRTPSPDPEDRAAAIEGWRRLVQDHPHDIYATLAHARLTELAPDVAAALEVRDAPGDLGAGWRVRAEVLADPGIGYGAALARIGLLREARAEWARVDLEALEAEEAIWLAELRGVAGDVAGAHHWLQFWARRHGPVEHLSDQPTRLVQGIYPPHFWDEIQSAAGGYAYPPRMLHGLVRQESSFNPRAVSFAGARGLSQLMPATARTVADWLGMSITLDDLFDPETNLAIGARYLHSVHTTHDRNPMLAMASYNAGPTRVKQWVREWDNPPLDEFIERIPYRETRGYVKSVTSAWQTMRYAYDVDDAPFPDLARFNHRARPDLD